jgi:hypothetical protein
MSRTICAVCSRVSASPLAKPEIKGLLAVVLADGHARCGSLLRHSGRTCTDYSLPVSRRTAKDSLRYHERRPHASLYGMTPDPAYFMPLPFRSAA